MSTDLPYSTQPLQPGPPPRTSGTAIVALVLASSAARELDQYPGQLTGHGLVTASRWLAAIHFAIVGLFIGVVLILVAGFGVSLFGFGLHQPSSAPAPVQSPPNATSLDTSPPQARVRRRRPSPPRPIRWSRTSTTRSTRTTTRPLGRCLAATSSDRPTSSSSPASHAPPTTRLPSRA